MRPKSVLGYRTKSSLDRIGDNDPKNQRVGTSGHKKWGPGACPWCSFPRLSSKKVGLPRRSRRGTHVAGSTLQRFQRSHLPMAEGPGPLSPHFSGEMGTPAGQAGPPGRCAPRRLRSCPPTGYAVPAALGPRPHLPMETVSHFGNKPKTLSQQAGGILIPTRFLRGPDCRPQRGSAAR